MKFFYFFVKCRLSIGLCAPWHWKVKGKCYYKSKNISKKNKHSQKVAVLSDDKVSQIV